MAPSALQMPEYVKEKVAAKGIAQHVTEDLMSVIGETDILYVRK